MKRWLMLSVLLMTAVAVHAADMERRQEAWELLRDGRALLDAGKFDEAEAKYLRAKEIDPLYPDVYANLGFLYGATKQRAQALEAYGQLLTLRPDHTYGRQAIKRLFYDGPFPRVMRAPYMAFSSVGFANDEVRMLTPEGETTRRIAYTTSLLFHEDMADGDGPVTVPLPVTAEKIKCQVNRSTYGFVMPPESDRYSMAFSLSYPSEQLSPKHGNYTIVSTRLMHLMLRFYCYGRVYLGRDFPEGEVSECYLCEEGPAGAESYKNSLYFYDAAAERTAVEWARQAGHELGHLLLPQIGGFTQPETYASGLLGERLFAQYLALEAGLVAGEPWPSDAAQQSVTALWAGDDFKLAGFIEKECRTSLDYWSMAGPDTPLMGGNDAGAMQYLIGFMLWTQAAQGPEMLHSLLQTATGTQPADYILAYKRLVGKLAEKGPVTVDAGAVNAPQSKLTQKPLEGALGRTGVKLAAGDTAAFAVFLPAGAWTLQIEPGGEGMAVTIDGKGPLPVQAGQGVALGRLDEGWHAVILQGGEKAEPRVLGRLVFVKEREA